MPDRNRYGLVIPPTAATSPRRLLPAKEAGLDFPTKHHLYWPKSVFVAAGSLACEFRIHPFNIVTLPRFQHTEYHARYNEAVEHQFPGELVPEDDVMATFLDEAKLLERLGVSMRAIDMIDEAIYEGRVRQFAKTYENRQAHLDFIASGIGKAVELEFIRPERYQHMIQTAAEFIVARAAA